MTGVKRLLVVLALAGCGDDGESSCPTAGPLDVGTDGHAEPLGAAPGEARAGRLRADQLPAVASGLITWQAGDFVLANNKVALVIEDVGDSELYDPWGGRPVGLGRVENGQIVAPNNFGELLLLTGRSTIITDSVSVISDGSDGGPAIIRARGKLHPLPFFDALTAAIYGEPWLDVHAALDYELAPDAEYVTVRFRFSSPRAEPKDVPSVMHGFMYTKRTPVFQPGRGFSEELSGSPWLAMIDDAATSWAYVPSDGAFGSSLGASGFLGSFAPGFTMPACGDLDREHARIVIGGPGVDGIQAAVARSRGEAQRTITGSVMRGGPVGDARVHAIDAAGAYLTRASTAADGTFTLNVPASADVRLDVVRRGEPIVTKQVGTGSDAGTITLGALGTIRVVATDDGTAVPARIQIVPAAGQTLPQIPDKYGEPKHAGGRLLIEYATAAPAQLAVPPGSWEVIVSRGFEYELVRRTVTVTAGNTTTVDAALDHAVATPGEQCGDFHIHTWRSNDSGDTGFEKVRQAVADGVELPIRSEHEWVTDFSAEINQLGLAAFANGMASIELTSMEIWGHMGVFPLTPDPSAVNNGAPKWQTFPTAASPDTPFELLSPPSVFDAVRARPEAPLVIINHPRGGANYYDYVGFDAATGMVSSASDWDTKFTLVEVLNDSSWQDKRQSDVADWLALLRAGRKVFAVGSSDSHELSSSPVGYPRTCIALGTDDPRQLTQNLVRDRLGAGHSQVSGGVYISAKIGTAGPGDTTTGAGSPLDVDVIVRAATWVDVDTIEVVVDGQTVDTIPILPGDADPTDATIRWSGKIPITTAAVGGFVVIAAYGDRTLEPVHPNRKPFGVANPIFVTP